ncbi:MAG: redoxin family protein [Candidatus Omnitrophica bacterium]|nr:redoxin family protein [Candidatus Omnitrophota bacterium]
MVKRIAALSMLLLLATTIEAKPFKKVVGQEFPAVKVTDLMTGKEVDLSKELKKDEIKGAVITFTCIGCPVAKAYEERKEDLVKKYGDHFVFIFLNANMGSETADAWKDYAKESGYSGVVAVDEGSKIAKEIGATVTPECYVINPKGTVVFHGPIDDSQDPKYIEDQLLANALESLVTGKELPEEKREMQAFGCGINYAKAE